MSIETEELEALCKRAYQLSNNASDVAYTSSQVLKAIQSKSSSMIWIQEENLKQYRENLIISIAKFMTTLTDSERLAIVRSCCAYCGDPNPQCQCWNDE